jgi:hypothetical protein
MALTEHERIIFSKTKNAGLGDMPLCGSLGSRTTLQSYHVRNGAEKA